jgi:hypothetical protein
MEGARALLGRMRKGDVKMGFRRGTSIAAGTGQSCPAQKKCETRRNGVEVACTRQTADVVETLAPAPIPD